VNDLDISKLDSIFDAKEIDNKFMGTISVFKNNKEIYSRSTGYSDIENNIKSNSKTKYRIGSISKIFTSVLIMQLIEEGKLTLETKLSAFKPQVKLAEQITIEQLLSHRSGIYNFTDLKDYRTWMETPISDEELIDKINNKGRRFKPNKKFEYSNTNYFLLSLIIEIIEGKSFKKVLGNKIIKPFKLSETYCCENIKNNETAKSYYREGESWKEGTDTDLRITSGAGGLISTSKDVNEFFNLLSNYKIISKESLDKMTNNLTNGGYGFGLMQIEFFDKTGFGHDGLIDGFISNAFIFPNDNLSITYLSNGFRMDIQNLFAEIIGYNFKTDYVDIKKYSNLKLTKEDLRHFEGIYTKRKRTLKITEKNNILILNFNEIPTINFALTPITKNRFKNEIMGIEIEFYKNEKFIHVYHNGEEIKLKKR
tara:strand:+ start:1102 stop:2373 length:1272 start_codon:yes stop_codon:yes gene_type:complete